MGSNAFTFRRLQVINCTINGDSIAVMMYKEVPYCTLQAKGGLTSGKWKLRFNHVKSGDVNIISLGANDWNCKQILDNLREIRNKFTGQVIWLIPNIKRSVCINAINQVEREFNDKSVDTRYWIKYGVHPNTEQQRFGIAGEMFKASSILGNYEYQSQRGDFNTYNSQLSK